jgi:4-amino-4-deoxy-L-arabinose transferase-like glycosyltransferase
MANEIAKHRKGLFVAFGCIFVIGIFFRLPPPAFRANSPLHVLAVLHAAPGFNGTGFDEGLYRHYINALSEGGIAAYPDLVEGYIQIQKKLPGSILPPMRFLFIFTGYIWHSVFGCETLAGLRQVASLFSCLTLILATLFAWRLRGSKWALGVAGLMAFAPTQIHMSQHALVDGFFTFWALLSLWLLWENLRRPHDWRLLVSFVIALMLLVLTKENSFFVWIALAGIAISNRWLRFGTISRELVVAMIIGPLFGVVVLIFAAGGIGTLFQCYYLSVGRNFTLRFAVSTGDGPWHRYLVDLLLVSPIVLILALGSVFRLNLTRKPELFLSTFIAASYLVMCNIKYGMNLRYANMWDMPLRFLAVSALASIAAPLQRYRNLAFVAALVVICATEMRQYLILFVQSPLEELVSEGLLRALHILKTVPQ